MARRGRKVGIVLLVLVLVLGGALVAADRIAAGQAEDAIAKQVSQQSRTQGIETSSEPEVEVGGFPFLTQVLGGRYDEIVIRLRDVRGKEMSVSRLDVHAIGVNAKASDLMAGRGPVTAERVTGAATVGYDTLSKALDMPDVTVSGQGEELKLRAPLTVAGRKVVVLATAKVSVTDGKLRVDVTEAKPESGGSSTVVNRVASLAKSRMSGTVALPELPYELIVESAKVTDGGLVITASATNVPLAK